MNEHVDELHEAAGAYALGALTEDETDAFEAHLGGCERCVAEVNRLLDAVELLHAAETARIAPAYQRHEIERPLAPVAIVDDRRRGRGGCFGGNGDPRPGGGPTGRHYHRGDG